MRFIYSILFISIFQLNILAQVLPVFPTKSDYFDKSNLQACRHLKSLNVEDNTYHTWDLTYNKIELELNPEVFYIKGIVTFEFKSLQNNLEGITIDLSNDLSIQSITNCNVDLVYKHQNDKVEISFVNSLNIDDTCSIKVEYKGIPTRTGFDSFAQNFHSGGLAAIYTLSEPYGAKEWWPCKQSLVDKIDSIDVIVQTPSKYETASNGKLVSDSVFNDVRICHWKHRHPIATYLVFVSSTVYNIYSDWATLNDGTKVEILNYVYPASLNEAKTQTPFTADLIELYSSLFIDYPFKDEKYGHAQFGWGGGMEHQTMSSMGGFPPSLIAHELAHQWFGDYITCGSWQEIWLNEGFATYLTGLYYEYLDSDPWWRRWRETKIQSITSIPDGSLFVQDTTDIWRIFDSRLSYNKGAYVLHMLRGQLGDDNFFGGMKAYLNDERVIDGFASTDLLRENMEQIADTTLSEFFNDWIYGEGHPIYNIDCIFSNHKLSVAINQTPSTAQGPFFEMNIPLSIYLNGERDIIWVPNKHENESLEYDLGYIPDSVLVDEELWLLGEFESTYSSVPYFRNEEFSIYYNQHEKILLVDVPDTEFGILSIYNLNGQLIERNEWSQFDKKISTSNFNTGIYLLHFTSPGKSLATKFAVLN